MAIAAVLSLVAGYVVLTVLLEAMTAVWETVPERWGEPPAWFVFGVLGLAGVIVYLVRRFVGDHGHSPLGGFVIAPLSPRHFVDVIAVIAVSLVGGVVLGPEVALVSTGAVVAGVVARWRPDDTHRLLVAGVAGAILALFIGSLLHGSVRLDGPPTGVQVERLAWAIPIALVVTVVIVAVRLLAGWVSTVAGARANPVMLIGGGLAIAAGAVAFQAWTPESAVLVVTSGEEYIAQLTALTSVSTLLILIVVKSLAYAVSLGAGFRGGPFFPAMFVGAAIGMLMAQVLPAGPAPAAGIAVGVASGVIATASMQWPAVIVLGAVIGYLLGGWVLVPAAVLGAVVSRLVPQWDRRRSAVH